MSCKEFFANFGDLPDVSQRLGQIDRAALLLWEAESASDHSPGVVDSEEILYRGIFIPHQFDFETNLPKPDAFHDTASFGMSVNRLQHASREEIIAKGRAKAEADNQIPERIKSGRRSLKGISRLQAGSIRNIVELDGVRGFFVFDTALANDISHADVFFAGSKPAWRRLRSFLFEFGKAGFEPTPE